MKVVEANENDGKIIISQKRCFQNQDDIKLGQVINATVLAIREYGVFVELESKQQGLLHISQITNVRLDKPLDQIFTVSDVIKVMVQDYEKRSGKVAVSTKVFEEHPGDMLVNATHVYAYAERNAVQHLERLEILKRELNPSA